MKKLLACLLFSLLMPCAHAADAIADLTALAESGDAGAQYALGEKYQSGDGVTKDCSVALQWHSKAADLGSIAAKLRLGLFYKNGVCVDKDTKRGFELIKNSAELGDPFAQLVVGKMYLDGVGVGSNVASGIQWLIASAEQGEDFAQYLLGEIYMLGRYGQARDWQNAIFWFTKNANNPGNTLPGCVLPLWYIGFMHHEGGYGVSQDVEEGMKWFAASGKNREEADVIIGVFYSTDDAGFEKDYAKARHYFTISPAHSAMAANALGEMYMNGTGVEAAIVQAAMWFYLADYVKNPNTVEVNANHPIDILENKITSEQRELAKSMADAWRQEHSELFKAQGV